MRWAAIFMTLLVPTTCCGLSLPFQASQQQPYTDPSMTNHWTASPPVNLERPLSSSKHRKILGIFEVEFFGTSANGTRL